MVIILKNATSVCVCVRKTSFNEQNDTKKRRQDCIEVMSGTYRHGQLVDVLLHNVPCREPFLQEGEVIVGGSERAHDSKIGLQMNCREGVKKDSEQAGPHI